MNEFIYLNRDLNVLRAMMSVCQLWLDMCGVCRSEPIGMADEHGPTRVMVRTRIALSES